MCIYELKSRASACSVEKCLDITESTDCHPVVIRPTDCSKVHIKEDLSQKKGPIKTSTGGKGENIKQIHG